MTTEDDLLADTREFQRLRRVNAELLAALKGAIHYTFTTSALRAQCEAAIALAEQR